MAVNASNNVSGWVGWVYLAGLLMVIRGISEGLIGISALGTKHLLFVTNSNVVVANLATWGWIHLVVGVFVLAAGFSVLHGSLWARIVGVFFVGASLLTNLVFVGSYPLWSIIAMVIDVFILYALLVHGDEARRA